MLSQAGDSFGRGRSPSTERKALTQINAPDLHIVPQFVRGARTKYTPFGDDVGAVGHTQGFADIVIGDQDPDAAGFQVEDDLL